MPADQPTGSRVGQLTSGNNGLPQYQSLDIAVRALDQPTRTAGQVLHPFWVVQAESVQVDQVDVGTSTRREHATIAKSVELRGITGQPVYGCLEGQPWSPGASTDPVREQIRGHAGVADDPAVCPAVTQTLQAHRIRHHVVQVVVVVTRVVQQRQQQEFASVRTQQNVVGDLPRI